MDAEIAVVLPHCGRAHLIPRKSPPFGLMCDETAGRVPRLSQSWTLAAVKRMVGDLAVDGRSGRTWRGTWRHPRRDSAQRCALQHPLASLASCDCSEAHRGFLSKNRTPSRVLIAASMLMRKPGRSRVFASAEMEGFEPSRGANPNRLSRAAH